MSMNDPSNPHFFEVSCILNLLFLLDPLKFLRLYKVEVSDLLAELDHVQLFQEGLFDVDQVLDFLGRGQLPPGVDDLLDVVHFDVAGLGQFYGVAVLSGQSVFLPVLLKQSFFFLLGQLIAFVYQNAPVLSRALESKNCQFFRKFY